MPLNQIALPVFWLHLYLESNYSNDQRSIACDSPAILRDQLCPSTFRHPQTHCVLKPMVRRSPWLFINSYFLYSIPVSICFLLHILRTVFTAFSVFIAGVSFSLRGVASCNVLLPYRFQISIRSTSSGSLYTQMGYNNSKDWVLARTWNFHWISVNFRGTKTSITKPLWFTKTVSSPFNCFATSCPNRNENVFSNLLKIKCPLIANVQQSESSNLQTARGWSAHQLHLCLMSACGKSFISLYAWTLVCAFIKYLRSSLCAGGY